MFGFRYQATNFEGNLFSACKTTELDANCQLENDFEEGCHFIDTRCVGMVSIERSTPVSSRKEMN